MPAAAPAILARQAAATAMAATNPVTLSNERPSQFVPILAIGIVIILTVAGLFGYRAWRSRRMAAESGMTSRERKLEAWYNETEDNLERPAKAATGNDYEAQAGWVPQIRTWKGIHVQGMQLPSESTKALDKKEKTGDLFVQPQRSPPPSYPVSLASAQRQALPTIVIPVSEEKHISEEDKPIASPLRTVSRSPMGPTPNMFLTNTVKSEEQLPLPRVMIVQSTFTPNLEDELSVVRGEAIRMLAEYKDGWCVVQRVGAYDSPKGVVPRSCLQERSHAVPVVGRRL